jgi:hypothetical protein
LVVLVNQRLFDIGPFDFLDLSLGEAKASLAHRHLITELVQPYGTNFLPGDFYRRVALGHVVVRETGVHLLGDETVFYNLIDILLFMRKLWLNLIPY